MLLTIFISDCKYIRKIFINYRQRKFKGYSDQIIGNFNNPFNLKFTFRIDADELINKKLIDEINFLINKNINGVFIKVFYGNYLNS